MPASNSSTVPSAVLSDIGLSALLSKFSRPSLSRVSPAPLLIIVLLSLGLVASTLVSVVVATSPVSAQNDMAGISIFGDPDLLDGTDMEGDDVSVNIVASPVACDDDVTPPGDVTRQISRSVTIAHINEALDLRCNWKFTAVATSSREGRCAVEIQARHNVDPFDGSAYGVYSDSNGDPVSFYTEIVLQDGGSKDFLNFDNSDVIPSPVEGKLVANLYLTSFTHANVRNCTSRYAPNVSITTPDRSSIPNNIGGASGRMQLSFATASEGCLSSNAEYQVNLNGSVERSSTAVPTLERFAISALSGKRVSSSLSLTTTCDFTAVLPSRWRDRTANLEVLILESVTPEVINSGSGDFASLPTITAVYEHYPVLSFSNIILSEDTSGDTTRQVFFTLNPADGCVPEYPRRLAGKTRSMSGAQNVDDAENVGTSNTVRYVERYDAYLLEPDNVATSTRFGLTVDCDWVVEAWNRGSGGVSCSVEIILYGQVRGSGNDGFTRVATLRVGGNDATGNPVLPLRLSSDLSRTIQYGVGQHVYHVQTDSLDLNDCTPEPFTPSLDIQLPTSGTMSPYASAVIDGITFERTADSAPECEHVSGGMIQQYEIANSGRGTRIGGGDLDLVAQSGRHLGSDTFCEYNVQVPRTIDHTAGRLFLESVETVSGSSTGGTAAVVYTDETPFSTFTPTVDITVPSTMVADGSGNAYEGVVFELEYTPTASSDSECEVFSASATQEYTVGSNGTVTITSGSDLLLIDQLEDQIGTTDRCEYSVSIPQTAGDANILRLVDASSAVTVNGENMASRSVSLIYTDTDEASLPFITLQNVHTLNTGEKASDSAEQVRVSLETLNECDPERQVPGPYVLDAGAEDLTGLLSTSCNWQLNFSHVAGLCQVTATAKNSAGATINPAASSGSLTLAGLSGLTALRYGMDITSVASIEFDITDTCASTFTPAATITIPPAPAPVAFAPDINSNNYTGLEFTVTYTSSETGCTGSATGSYVVGDDGTVGLPSGTSAPTLVHQPLAAIGKSIATTRCKYNVSFANQVGSLRVVGGATATVTGGDMAVPSTDVEVSATYEVILVDILVSTTFPVDRIFSSQERVDFQVDVLSPCGGVLPVLPTGYSSYGRLASYQALPGTVFVFGSEINEVLLRPETFTAPAYGDTRGNVPCSIQVTELKAPEGCTTTTESSQTKTYVSGSDTIAFEFFHTCAQDSSVVGITPPSPVVATDGPQPDFATS